MKGVFFTFLLVLCATIVSASEIAFLNNPQWAAVPEKAKKENKIIFLNAYATWSSPCMKMDTQTYNVEAVVGFYNENFINVKIDMQQGEGPMLAKRYIVDTFPNLIFISPSGVMLNKGIGFLPAVEFLDLGMKSKDPEKQYYTLKKKAKTMSNADFLKFSKMAVTVQDQDYFDISKAFLATKPDILGDADLINLLMQYDVVLPKQQDLDYFLMNRSKILREGKYTNEDIENKLAYFVMDYALSAEVQKGKEINYDAIKSLLDKYVPASAFFTFNDFKIKNYLSNKQNNLALETLQTLFDNAKKLKFEELCSTVEVMATALHDAGKLEAYLKKLDDLNIPEQERHLTYMKSFTKALCYSKIGQKDKMKKAISEAIYDKNIPADIKKQLEQTLMSLW